MIFVSDVMDCFYGYDAVHYFPSIYRDLLHLLIVERENAHYSPEINYRIYYREWTPFHLVLIYWRPPNNMESQYVEAFDVCFRECYIEPKPDFYKLKGT